MKRVYIDTSGDVPVLSADEDLPVFARMTEPDEGYQLASGRECWVVIDERTGEHLGFGAIEDAANLVARLNG